MKYVVILLTAFVLLVVHDEFIIWFRSRKLPKEEKKEEGTRIITMNR